MVKSVDTLNSVSSSAQTLTLSVIDPCDSQTLSISPFASAAVSYDLRDPPLLFQLQVAKSVDGCPVETRLKVTCNGEACPDLVTVASEDQVNFEVAVSSALKVDVGEYTITAQAVDDLSGLLSEATSLTLAVTNSCN